MENVNTIINFSLFRLGGVTCLSIIIIYRMLPHLSAVPHLHVNSP